MAVQVRADEARMHGVGGDASAGGLGAMRKFVGEQNVRRFALAVGSAAKGETSNNKYKKQTYNVRLMWINLLKGVALAAGELVEADTSGVTHLVRIAADSHHAGVGLFQRREKLLYQVKVTHVVGSKLHFHTILASRCKGTSLRQH